ncbi:MAG TPA: hypothetical protein VM431_10250 [Phycisphaerae bacterium]|nr:hypothetical protein [Phycisphaerae bacterium]
MQPISKGFYLGSIVAGMVGGLVLFGIGFILMISEEEEAGTALMGLGYIPLIYGAVIVGILIYKMWAAIQGPTARTTPGKAVGFLFIPFFNIYWQFQAFWGWTKDYNALIAQRGIAGRRAPEGLAMAMCILTLCGIIPVVGMLFSLVNVILMFIFYNAAIDGANAVITANAQESAPQA